jgi:hypothetical protein
MEGRTDGHAEFRMPGAPERRLPVRGAFVLEGRNLSADVQALEGDSLRLALRVLKGRVERLEARARDVDLQPFLGWGGGSMSLDAFLHGDWERLTGDASLRLRELRLKEASLGDAEVLLALHEGSGRFDMTAPAPGATGDAALHLGAGGGVRGTLRVTSLEIARVAPLLPEALRAGPATGQVTAVAEFDVPFSGARGARVVGSISSLKAESGEWSLDASAPRFVFDRGDVSLESLVAKVNGVEARLSGRIGLEGRPSDVALHLDADLAGLLREQRSDGVDHQEAAQQQVDARLAIEMRRQQPAFHCGDHVVVEAVQEIHGSGRRRRSIGRERGILPETIEVR